MRNVVSIFILGALLAACEHNPSWDRDCHRNYSVNERELALCKKKVTENQSHPTDSNAVTIDSANTNKPSLERLGKAHDRAKNY